MDTNRRPKDKLEESAHPSVNMEYLLCPHHCACHQGGDTGPAPKSGHPDREERQ